MSVIYSVCSNTYGGIITQHHPNVGIVTNMDETILRSKKLLFYNSI